MKIGIDIGGSHIGIGVVDENGRIIDKVETFIKDKSDIEEKIEKYLLENVTKMLQKYSINQIGIAVPGTVSDTKITKAVNLGIEDYDLGKILEEKLKNEGYTVKVKLKNDGKCAGLAEQKYGELQGYDNSVFLYIFFRTSSDKPAYFVSNTFFTASYFLFLSSISGPRS